MNTEIKITTGGTARAGYRSVCKASDSLQAAIERLAADGHLGRRKCIITKNFAAIVKRGASAGRGGRVPTSRHPHARHDSPLAGLEVAAPEYAWLEVPAGLEQEAADIVARVSGRPARIDDTK